jgi:hypothetical protein
MTRRLHPGWLVAFFALVVSVSAWLPWLTTSENGGGWASAIGGAHRIDLPPGFGAGQLIVLLASTLLVAGAMVGRGLSMIIASIAALTISLLIAVLIVWYYKLNISPTVSAQYGLYIGAAGAVFALVCSVWSVIAAVASRRTRR